MDHRKILFVCLGNICRSPLGEGILRHRAEMRGLSHLVSTDSAGTGGWHQERPPTLARSRSGDDGGGHFRAESAKDQPQRFQRFRYDLRHGSQQFARHRAHRSA
nr:hypothetical protein [Rhizobium sp. G21]